MRFEHHGGAAETFATVSAPGFHERFFAGQVALTTFSRVVGLDAAGRVVAEYDEAKLNKTPV